MILRMPISSQHMKNIRSTAYAILELRSSQACHRGSHVGTFTLILGRVRRTVTKIEMVQSRESSQLKGTFWRFVGSGLIECIMLPRSSTRGHQHFISSSTYGSRSPGWRQRAICSSRKSDYSWLFSILRRVHERTTEILYLVSKYWRYQQNSRENFTTTYRQTKDLVTLIQIVEYIAANKGFVITERGYLGWASPLASRGDEVAILFACSMRCVLRKLPDRDGYQHLGSTVLNSEVLYKDDQGRHLFPCMIAQEGHNDWFDWDVKEKDI